MADLPHEAYITAVADALTAAGIEPEEWETRDSEENRYDASGRLMLDAIISWPAETGVHGLMLIWDHPAEQWQYMEIDGGYIGLREPDFLPTLPRYADPGVVAAAAQRLLVDIDDVPTGDPAPEWPGAADTAKAVEQWAAEEAS